MNLLTKRIKGLCAERGISLYTLEKELGIGNGTIAKWTGRSPRIENVKRVADYFGVTVDDLLADTQDQGRMSQ